MTNGQHASGLSRTPSEYQNHTLCKIYLADDQKRKFWWSPIYGTILTLLMMFLNLNFTPK